jgi:gluconokinase
MEVEDADDDHPEENRRKMAAGIPLTDADREPWLKAMHERMVQYRQKDESIILACSALKQRYRDLLSDGFSRIEMRFVYLHGRTALIRERSNSRRHPYMNPELLDSQLATLEVPSEAWSISVAGSPEQAVEQILTRLCEAGVLTTERRNHDDPYSHP